MGRSSWQEDTVRSLTSLWADGYSASQIARRLGKDLTRNAVIGKIHRMGLAERSQEAVLRRRQEGGLAAELRLAEAQASAMASPRTEGSLALKPKVIEPAPRKVNNVVRLSRPVNLLELNDHTCRWPVEVDPDCGFFFCGKEPISGQRYCKSHYEIAYQKARKSSRR